MWAVCTLKCRQLLNSTVFRRHLSSMIKDTFLPARCQVIPRMVSAQSFDHYSQRQGNKILDKRLSLSSLERMHAYFFDWRNLNAFENVAMSPYGFSSLFPLKQMDGLIAVNRPESIGDFFQISSGLIYFPLIVPSSELPLKHECVNDIQNRRRKMKKHKRKKWHKKFASLLRKFRMQREKKNEKKLQELLKLYRNRSEAWDPAAKIEQRLMFARRSGFYVDILSTRGGLHLK
ncbi:hypothetical protein Aperf_G00000126785 [Anoplocephala perfoliata]